MDTATQNAVDKQLAAELLGNGRIVEHEVLGKVLLKRPNLHEEAKIGEVRRQSYQRDLKNPDVLSRKEIEKIAVERGMWDETSRRRIQELMQKTGEAMALLEGTGFKSVEELAAELAETGKSLKAEFGDDLEGVAEIHAAIERLVGDDELNPEDRKLVYDKATGSKVWDLLDEIDILRGQVRVLKAFVDQRVELAQLRVQETELFLDSLESRAEREQEFATLYYCAVNADTKKPLWESMDGLRTAEPHHIAWIMQEYSNFINGITPETQEMLVKYGFMQRQSDTNNGSDATPVLPPSKSDGVVMADEPTDTLPVSDSEPTPTSF